MTDKKTPLAKKAATAVAVPFNYGEMAGVGMEDVDSSEVSIPFLTVLQSLSPQVEEDGDAQIEGAKAGMLFNSVTQELIPGATGITIVPVHREHVYCEWVPRDSGGGLVAVHQPKDDFVKQVLADSGKKFGKIELDNGNELIETFNLYILTVENGATSGFAILSFTSTKIKAYKRFISGILMVKGSRDIPLFAYQANLVTVKDKNKKGSFFNVNIKPTSGNWRGSLMNPEDDAEIFQEALGYREMILDGSAKAAYDSTEADAGASEEGSVPF